MEKNKLEHRPKYFEEWTNPDDAGQTYYKYTEKYFEVDRPKRNWEHLPDIYSEKLAKEVEEFE